MIISHTSAEHPQRVEDQPQRAPSAGDRPLRFCMVTTYYPPYHFGGDATFVRALSRALVDAGHHVEVVHCEDAFRLRGHEPVQDENVPDGVTVHRVRSRFKRLSPIATQQFGIPGFKTTQIREVLNGPFDVVNFHNISLVGGPGILKLSRATVTLYTVHEHWLLCPTHILWKDLERACDGPQCLRCCMRSGLPPQLWRYTGLVERALTHVDALLAPSAFTAERHRTVAKHVPIHKMPTFSDIDPDVQVTAAKGARPRFVFVGRITASKGIAVLLDECEHTTAFDLDVVGDGDLRADLQRRYAHCAHIRFRGPVPQHDLVGLYQGATALVLPSLAPEVFPLTVLEAMACGTPAIVHDVGGNREAVDETGGGLVYDTRAELRNALFSMATDRELQLAMAQKARTGFERLYTRRQYLVRYLDLVRNISCRNSQATKA